MQAVQHGEWSSAAVRSALALCPVTSPIADAAIRLASEHDADQYAAQIGYTDALTVASGRCTSERPDSRCCVTTQALIVGSEP